MNNILTAQELKTKGAQILEEKTRESKEAVISVRGKNTYVVLTMDQYNHLRECELDAALRESEMDIAAGRFKVMEADEHLNDLENV